MDETRKKLIARLLGGGGAAGSVVFVYLFMDAKTEALEKKIDDARVSWQRQIDESDSRLSDSLNDIKKSLDKMDQRLFDLIKQSRRE